MANLSAIFGAGVKSIQAVVATIANGAFSGTVTIASVNTTKSVMLPASLNTTFDLVLTNATTITVSRPGNGAAQTINIQVVEFY